MSLFYDHLAAQVTAALRSGVAVIVDPDAAFEPFVEEVAGTGAWSSLHPDTYVVDLDGTPARLARFRGSWFGLKAAVEPFLSLDGPPDPPLLVYIPAALPSPAQDVLMELVLAGQRLDWSLDKQARACMRQKFTDGVIDEVLSGGTATFLDVVRFLAQGTRAASKLRAIFPHRSDSDILLAWLAEPAHDAAITAKGADGELRKLVTSRLGLTLEDDVDLPKARARTARYVLVAEFRHDLDGDAPAALAMIPTPGTDAQREEALELSRRFRSQHADAYVVRSDQVTQELHLDTAGIDPATLGRVDTFRFEERALLGWCAKLLTDKRYAEALAVVDARGPSFWVEREVERQAQWELCRRVGELGLRIEGVSGDLPGKGASPADWVRRYAAPDGWHAMDGAQRALDTFRAQMADEAACEQAAAIALRAHETLLHKMAERFGAALAEAGWAVPGVLHQTRVVPDVVEPHGGPVAYLWVDAMRYEMGAELARLLEGVEDLHLQPAVAALPSITPVGMAALLPGASTDFFVAEQSGRLVAVVDGNPVANAKDREKHVKARVPDSVDLTLSQVLQYKPSELASRVAGKALVVVRSQEIDELGEKGNDWLARRAMAEVLGDLSRAIRKLARAGLERFVVTADHGHQFGLRKGDDMKTDAPGGETVELHRRCWIGRGGTTPAGTVRVTAGQLGYRSDLDFVFPTGLGVLKAGGDLSFHHGSTSLQELVVPVLSFRVPGAAAEAKPSGVDVRLVDAPPVVTNLFFQVTVEVTAKDLFGAEPVALRVVLLCGQEQVGHAGMADVPDFDRRTGVVRVKPGGRAQLVMRLTREDVESLKIVVLDPESTAVLAQSAALTIQLMR